MIKTDDKGFSIIETFLVVVIIGLIGGIGYYVYSAQQKANTNLKQATNSTSAPTTKPKLNAYTDKLAGYTIDYPSNWKVKTSSKYLEYAKADVSTTIATSDTGLTLTFEHNFGGRGGECPPAASDTPFATGNKCPTDEIIYAEKTGHTVLLLDSSMEHPSPVYNKHDIYLTREKYASPEDSKVVYFSGLSADRSGSGITKSKPEMGLLVPFSILTNYTPNNSPKSSIAISYYVDIKMSPQGNGEDFFKQTDVKQAEAILKSFRFN